MLPPPQRFDRKIALAVAEELHAALVAAVDTPFGHTKPAIAIVGSTRRGKPTVKDLELLFIPRIAKVADPLDLFGKTIEADAVACELEKLIARGVLKPRPKCDGSHTWGEAIKLAVHVATGLPVDLFTARPGNWYNLMVCRTGGKETNEAICNAAIAKGLKWSPQSPGFLNRTTLEVARTVRSERDVFTIAGLEYLEPHQRA